jgi:hypothetical protein
VTTKKHEHAPRGTEPMDSATMDPKIIPLCNPCGERLYSWLTGEDPTVWELK